jgi:hypothetical protein
VRDVGSDHDDQSRDAVGEVELLDRARGEAARSELRHEPLTLALAADHDDRGDLHGAAPPYHGASGRGGHLE